MRPKLVLFGDSITEDSFNEGGWGATLAHHFRRKCDVVLRGYSGYNTRWALKVVERVFDGLEGGGPVAAVTVFFGANDATLPDRAGGFQHVPVHEYMANLKAILSFLMERCGIRSYVTKLGIVGLDVQERWPMAVVLLITPPPIDEDGRIKNPYGGDTSGLPERTNGHAGTYANACKNVATEVGVPVVDLWSKIQLLPGWEKIHLCDGLHLTPEGCKVVVEEVVEKLKENGVDMEAMSLDLPLFVDIDPIDPFKGF